MGWDAVAFFGFDFLAEADLSAARRVVEMDRPAPAASPR